jgi:hypothetical protein
MKTKNAIVIIIGGNGASFFAFDGKETKSEFIEAFNDTRKQSIEKLFGQFPKLPIYVVLDTIEQSYKKKVYPGMRSTDFARVAKRDMSADGDKESFKNFLIVKTPKSKKGARAIKDPKSKKIDCLFAICSTSPSINSWLEFIYTLPNRLFGIFALPIESVAIFTKMRSFVKENFKEAEPKNQEVFCMVSQTKCGGIRQTVFSNGNLVFTRIVNYNFNEKSFADKYYQDLLSTFEYLKRLYVDLTLPDFQVINILPSQAAQELAKNSGISTMNYANYLPEELSKTAGIKSASETFKDYFDQSFFAIFLSSSPILKFSNIKIKVFDQFFATLQISKILNIFLTACLLPTIFYSVIYNSNYKNILKEKEEKKIEAETEFSESKKLLANFKLKSSNGTNLELADIIDIGSFYEKYGKQTSKPWDYYEKLSFLNKAGYIADKYNFSSSSSQQKDSKLLGGSSDTNKFLLEISGSLINESGEIDALFKKYDDLLSKSESSLKEEKYKFSELPKNIDFNKKYYDFPVELQINIENKQK